ncbi:hypothetical protein ACFLY6_01000 [Candidatus Dependentiae bacterium]
MKFYNLNKVLLLSLFFAGFSVYSEGEAHSETQKVEESDVVENASDSGSGEQEKERQITPSIYRILRAYFMRAYGSAEEKIIKERFKYQDGECGTGLAKICLTPTGKRDPTTCLREHLLLYDLFTIQEESEKLDEPDPMFMGYSCWTDTRLFCGDFGSWHANILGQIDRCRTSMGTVYLSRLLSSPITNVAVLKKRQEMISTLVFDKAFFDKIDACIAKVRPASSELLSMWRRNSKASNSLSGISSFYPSEDGLVGFLNWTGLVSKDSVEPYDESDLALGLYSVQTVSKLSFSFLGCVCGVGRGVVDVAKGIKSAKDEWCRKSWKDGIKDLFKVDITETFKNLTSIIMGNWLEVFYTVSDLKGWASKKFGSGGAGAGKFKCVCRKEVKEDKKKGNFYRCRW